MKSWIVRWRNIVDINYSFANYKEQAEVFTSRADAEHFVSKMKEAFNPTKCSPLSKYITIEGLEIGDYGGDNGIYCKIDVNPLDSFTWSTNYKMVGNRFIGNWVHLVGGEGMYIGDTDSGGEIVFKCSLP